MAFITTARGEGQFLNDHYLKNKNKTRYSGNIYWEYADRWSGNGCDQHTDPANPKLTAVKKIRVNMKRDAGNADLTTKYTVSANIAGSN